MKGATMAQLVERVLGKDEVISSTLISSSSKGIVAKAAIPILVCRRGGIGRRDGLKIR